MLVVYCYHKSLIRARQHHQISTTIHYILSCLFSKIGVLSRRDLLNHISTEPSGEVDILFRRSRRDRTPILEKRHDSFYISETHLKKFCRWDWREAWSSQPATSAQYPIFLRTCMTCEWISRNYAVYNCQD